MAPATHIVLRIVALLVILVAYLLPHRHSPSVDHGVSDHGKQTPVATRH